MLSHVYRIADGNQLRFVGDVSGDAPVVARPKQKTTVEVKGNLGFRVTPVAISLCGQVRKKRGAVTTAVMMVSTRSV